MTTVRLEPDQLDRLADLIAERLRTPTAGDRLIDARQLADQLGVDRSFVYAHADLLGARRLGGPRGRLRFDVETARTALATVTGSAPRPAPTPRRSRRRPVTTGSILKVRA